jgi:acetyl esterase/lipase
VPAEVVSQLDLAYGSHPEARLDCFAPAWVEDTGSSLGTIIWIHGGAWIAGDKAQLTSYLKVVAAQGFTVIGVNYPLAPAARYPTPVEHLHQALAWVVAHAESLHVDPERLVLAGDSAGAQLAAQLTAMITCPDYAAAVAIPPTIQPSQLRGVVLFCGIYDVSLLEIRGRRSWFLKTIVWAYSGADRIEGHPSAELFCIPRWVTDAFPTPFISVGNADPLVEHSLALVEALGACGVASDTLFFRDDHRPSLGHEYQFDSTLDAFDEALDRLVAYLNRCVVEVSSESEVQLA